MRAQVIDALLFATDRLRVAVLTVAVLGMAQTAVAVWGGGDQPPRSAAKVERIGDKS